MHIRAAGDRFMLCDAILVCVIINEQILMEQQLLEVVTYTAEKDLEKY
jgi:hypothetical protein